MERKRERERHEMWYVREMERFEEREEEIREEEKREKEKREMEKREKEIREKEEREKEKREKEKREMEKREQEKREKEKREQEKREQEKREEVNEKEDSYPYPSSFEGIRVYPVSGQFEDDGYHYPNRFEEIDELLKEELEKMPFFKSGDLELPNEEIVKDDDDKDVDTWFSALESFEAGNEETKADSSVKWDPFVEPLTESMGSLGMENKQAELANLGDDIAEAIKAAVEKLET